MKIIMSLFAIVLALIAFDPNLSIAKDHGSSKGQSNSGQQNSGQQNSGMSNSGQQGSNFHGSDNNNMMKLGVGSNFSPPNKQPSNSGMNTNQNFSVKNKPEFKDSKEGHDDWRYRFDNGRWWFWGPGDRWMWYGDNGRWLDYGNAYVVRRPILENFSGAPIKIVNPAKNTVTLNYLLNGATYSIPPGYSQDLSEDRAWVIQFSRGADMDQAKYGLQSGVYTFANTNHGWELFRSDFPQTGAPLPPSAAPTNPTLAPSNPSTAPVNPPSQ
jgi:hypothetical protein